MATRSECTKRQGLVEEALSACGTLPPHERLVDLNEGLRAELAELVPVVTEQSEKLDQGTPEWHARARALRAVASALEEDLGTGLLSAAMHVAELGRRVLELDRYAASGPQSS